MSVNNIKVIKHFMDENEMQEYKRYNDWLLENKSELFFMGGSGKRPVLQFGKDLHHTESSYTSLEGIIEDGWIGIIESLWQRVINISKAVFDDNGEVYPCSFWFAKQFPGAEVNPHNDSDDGANPHFKYSAIVYMSTLDQGGELEFIDLQYKIKPEAGDLVLFTSQDTGEHQVTDIPEIRYTLPMWFTADKQFSLFR